MGIKSNCNAWQITYCKYEGVEKHAVNFLSAELFKYLARDNDVYTLYVLPCVDERERDLTKNTVVLGAFDQSETVRKFVKRDELPQGGWLVKTVKESGDDGERQFIIITADKASDLYFAAAAFVDEFMVKFAPVCCTVPCPNKFFEYDIADHVLTWQPKTKVRSVWTWGHPLNDYRTYVRDCARLRVNRIIAWNDFVPVNALEIVNYAHEFGIQFVWGFAWGWIDGCAKIKYIGDDYLENLKREIVDRYEREYSGVSPDGVYFQSFTEIDADDIGGRRISEAVVKLVNETSAILLERHPDLKIIFGLHARSVKNHLDDIAAVNPRVEILWEDWGSFPSDYTPSRDKAKVDELVETTRNILKLRDGNNVGFLFKGFLTLDWTRFVYQGGRFVLGENGKEITDHDFSIRSAAWRIFQAGWIECGDEARRVAEVIVNETGGNVEIGMCGCFDGGMWAAESICSEIVLDPSRDYGEIVRVALSKPGVRFA